MRRSTRLITAAHTWYRNRFSAPDHLPLPEQRRAHERLWRPPPPRGTSIQRVDAGRVPAEWVWARGVGGDRVVLYLHGGAYLYGSARIRRGLTSRLSRSGGARVLAVDYRLAPEYPFPAAVEDAVGACRWLLDGGVDPGRVVVGGDSAGGGLAVASALALREAGEPLPAGLLLLSPWLDLEGEQTEARQALAERDRVLDPDGLAVAASLYLAGQDARHPLASPVGSDLGGLPPTLIQVGTEEILADDALRFADAARAAGVTVLLDEWPGMGHVFQTLVPLTAESRQAVNQMGCWVRRVVP